jgi:hypothetical protein
MMKRGQRVSRDAEGPTPIDEVRVAKGRYFRTIDLDGMILATLCLTAVSLSSCSCAMTLKTPKKPVGA